MISGGGEFVLDGHVRLSVYSLLKGVGIVMLMVWSGWFVSALWSVFKQAPGAFLLGVSLRLVCSRLQTCYRVLASQPLLAVD